MCGLCGLFNQAGHWSDETGVSPGGGGPAGRQHRAYVANRMLAPYGLKLSPWSNRFTLVNRTGRMAVIDHVGALWPEAERLAGRVCDPLDPAILDRLDTEAAGR